MLSAVLIVKNEEQKVERAIQSLSFCDEIVIVDDHSNDNTVKIIRRIDPGAKIVERALNNDFSTQRNFGLSLAKGDWILFVDADEIVTSELAKEIKKNLKVAELKGVKGYYLKRKDFFLGRWLNHGENGNIKLLRLAKKDAGRWEGKVHEEWKIKGKTEILNNYLLHYSHDNLSELTQKISFYSTIRAQELLHQGEKSSWLEIICYPIGKFLLNYFWRLGLLDGMPGLLMAIEMSFHSFLVRSKLYLLTRQK